MSKPRKFHKIEYPYTDVITLVHKFASDKKSVLEIGCGSGGNLVFLADAGFDAYGIDLDGQAIAYARKLLRSRGVSAHLRVGDAMRLPYAAKTFDVVLDRACIQHNKPAKIRRIIAEAERVLKPGGIFFLINIRSRADFAASDIRRDYSFKDIYKEVYFTSVPELRSLLKNFKILRLEHRKGEILMPAPSYTEASFIVVAQKPDFAVKGLK